MADHAVNAPSVRFGRAFASLFASSTRRPGSRYWNQEPVYGYYHHLLRINENFGRIDLDMPVNVVLDIPPNVEGGVQLPIRLDHGS